MSSVTLSGAVVSSSGIVEEPSTVNDAARTSATDWENVLERRALLSEKEVSHANFQDL